MYRIAIGSVLLIGVLAGCQSKSAFNFSQDIVAKEKSLIAEAGTMQEDMERCAAAEQYDSVAIVAEKMEAGVQEKIDEIEAMPLPDAKMAKEFKDAALKYFHFIKSLYTGYKKWGRAATQEERDEIYNELILIDKNKERAVDEMQRAQKVYANANGFKIEK